MPPKAANKAGTSTDGPDVPAVPGATEANISYPKCVLLILTNELCERFSFYGIKTIISMYFLTILDLTQIHTTIFYHVFTGLCYFTPLLGGYIANNYLGDFRTIFYISLIYIAGHILLVISSAPLKIPKLPISSVSLILIAIGAGGIKACTLVLGADQFTMPQHAKYLDNYFFFFYFMINVGAASSAILTPLLRDLDCLGEDSCYVIGFGIPVAMMIVGFIILMVGKPWYKMNHTKGRLTEACKCICVMTFDILSVHFLILLTITYVVLQHALYNKHHHPVESERVQHWLDRAEDKYDKALITDCKRVLRISLVLLPGIIFWSLYDQSGSTWTSQACRMNGNVGNFIISPDHMQFVNPILILLMIPFFQYAAYPLCIKLGLLKRQLSRMCCGGFLLTISFAMVSVVSLKLEWNDPIAPEAGEAHLRIYNSLKCSPTVTSSIFGGAPKVVGPMDFITTNVDNVIGEGTYNYTVTNCNELPYKEGTFYVEEAESKGYYLSKRGMISFEDDISKDEKMSGYPKLRILIDDPDVKLELKVASHDGVRRDMRTTADGSDKVKPLVSETVQFTKNLKLIEVTKPNDLNILWQLPQYFFYTAAETMFSISALEFSYSQAPDDMKSFVQALQMSTTFFGNCLTIIFKSVTMFDRSNIGTAWKYSQPW